MSVHFTRMTFEEYVLMFGCDIVHWAHFRARVNKSLAYMLQEVGKFNVQILYANTELVTKPNEFRALCELIVKGTIWGLNVGEARFTAHQCQLLYKSIENSKVAFMFMDSILVGNYEVKRFKTLIQERRRQTISERWLMEEGDDAQNEIIMKCRNMWFSPWSLGRNKKISNQTDPNENSKTVTKQIVKKMKV